MSQHDYTLANASGSAFRADANNALAAIATKNSGDNAPSTTYAFLDWAETDANIIHRRNEANDAWIPIATTDGGVILKQGATGAGNLSLYFDGDTNTGIWRSAANTINLQCAAADTLVLSDTEIACNEPLHVDSSSPVIELHNTTHEDSDGGRESTIRFRGQQSGGEECVLAEVIASHEGTSDDDKGELIFKVAATSDNLTPTEAMRLNSSRQLLVGHNEALNVGSSSNRGRVQIHTTDARQLTTCRFTASDAPARISIGKSRGGSPGTFTILQDNDYVGAIEFKAADGNDCSSACAGIWARINGAPGADDVPGRLVFGTTSDGSNDYSERATILANGRMGLGTSAPISDFDVDGKINARNDVYSTDSYYGGRDDDNVYAGGSGEGMFVYAASDDTTYIQASDAVDTGNVFLCKVNGSDRIEFDADGDGHFDGVADAGNADFAEYFEWEDGNPSNEDRRGYPVVISNGKVRKATSSDAASSIIGAVSAEPGFVGNAAALGWKDRYKTDDFGTRLRVDIVYLVWNKEGAPQPKAGDYRSCTSAEKRAPIDKIDDPKYKVPAFAKTQNIRVTEKGLVPNPAFDSSKNYISRQERKEWATIGLLGQVPIRKGEPTGDRWIKLKEMTSSLELWLVR